MADLIAFYSRRGQNYFDGEIKEVKKGNTEINPTIAISAIFFIFIFISILFFILI